MKLCADGGIDMYIAVENPKVYVPKNGGHQPKRRYPDIILRIYMPDLSHVLPGVEILTKSKHLRMACRDPGRDF